MRCFWCCRPSHTRIFWHKVTRMQKKEARLLYETNIHGKYHIKMRPWCIYESNSPQELPWAPATRAFRECVGSVTNRYNNTSSLQEFLLMQKTRVPVRLSRPFPKDGAETPITFWQSQLILLALWPRRTIISRVSAMEDATLVIN